MPEKCCGNCSYGKDWYTERSGKKMGICLYRPPMPDSVYYIDTQYRDVWEREGTDCPCHSPRPEMERKEER